MKVPILLPNIFDHPFTYERGKIDLKLGDYVTIPFGKAKSTGVVWDKFEKEKKKNYLIKNVISKLNISPSVLIHSEDSEVQIDTMEPLSN